MALLSLSHAEHDELIRIHQTSDDQRLCDRARAMIILGHGESIDRTAEILSVSPRTIYAWLHRFTEDTSLLIETRLKDKPRSGRPHKIFTTNKNPPPDERPEPKKAEKLAEEALKVIERLRRESMSYVSTPKDDGDIELTKKPPRTDRGEN